MHNIVGLDQSENKSYKIQEIYSTTLKSQKINYDRGRFLIE